MTGRNNIVRCTKCRKRTRVADTSAGVCAVCQVIEEPAPVSGLDFSNDYRFTGRRGSRPQRIKEASSSQASHASSRRAKKKAREGERAMEQEHGEAPVPP
jgi:hypothetical protein